jgi:hypothetical protein
VAVAGVTGVVTPSAPEARSADQCGLPDSRPLWIDYAEGSVSFRNGVFGRPGVVAATSGVANSEALRARGAHTVYWWMRLGRLVGTTVAPADPATISAAAADVAEKAIAASGCGTPVIVLNELNGAATTTPWTATNGQYRANVLELLRQLAAKGARPLLLVSARPYLGGEALDWWRQAAQVADLVREVYFPAPRIMRMGVVVGSRTMRQSFRQSIADFTAIGVLPQRLGLVLGFQSGPGKGGREGLQPTAAWLRFVKLQTLAAAQVGRETKIGSIVSWGWGTFNAAGADVDKQRAACVYLWARDDGLCDGKAAGGPGFETSREEGQILLRGDARCGLDGQTLTKRAVSRLAAVTQDREVAASALFARLVESARAAVSPQQVLAAERSIVAGRFAGSRSAYLSALGSERAGAAIARAIIADQLRRQAISRRLAVPSPTAAQIATFHALYPALPVRRVKASPGPSWLGGKRSGLALVPPGPTQLLTLPTARTASLLTSEGRFSVTPLEPAVPLGAVSLSAAQGAVRSALLAYARADAFAGWTMKAQARAQSRAVCIADALPAVAAVDLASYLPFLALEA